jgi:hypothetical protein
MVVYQGSEGVRMEYPEKSCACKAIEPEAA